MKIKPATTTLLLILTYSLSIAQQRQSIRGVILSTQDSLPIPYVDISIEKLKTGVVSNILGVFKISTLSSDTLVISGVGYNKKTIAAADLINNNISDTIYVAPAIYILDEVKVNNNGIELNSRRIGTELNKIPIEVRSKGLGDNSSLFSHIKHPAAALNKLSKDEKERKEARVTLTSIEIWKDFYSKATANRAKRITGASDEEIDKFMIYFNTRHNLQPTSSLMEISERIDYLWKTFVEKRSIKWDTIYVSPKEYQKLMKEQKRDRKKQ